MYLERLKNVQTEEEFAKILEELSSDRFVEYSYPDDCGLVYHPTQIELEIRRLMKIFN